MPRSVAFLLVLLAIGVAGVAGFVVFDQNQERAPSSAGKPIDRSPVSTISTGESVNIEDYLEDGVATVIDFTAPW